MRKEIIVNSSPHEVRVAILEDGELVELLVERADAKRIVGNVYKGRVSSVKPGLQAAFVDLGLDKAGFLHATDLQHSGADEETGEGNGEFEPVTEGEADPAFLAYIVCEK